MQIASLTGMVASLRAELQRAVEQREQTVKDKEDMVQANLRVGHSLWSHTITRRRCARRSRR